MTLFLLLVWLGSAWAGPLEDAQAAELERVRGEVAGQIQLKAYDLVDELVYGLTQEPPFAEPTPVVLAGVTVPVGLGTALQARLETHLSGVLLANPTPTSSRCTARSAPPWSSTPGPKARCSPAASTARPPSRPSAWTPDATRSSLISKQKAPPLCCGLG